MVENDTAVTSKEHLPKMPHKNCSAASLSSAFYSRCSELGISPIEAGSAVSFSHNWYRDWWKQERITTQNNDQEETSKLEKEKENLEALQSCRKHTGDHKQDDDSEGSKSENHSSLHSPPHLIPIDDILTLKNRVLYELRSNNGDITAPSFMKHLDMLSELYKSSSPSNDCNTHASLQGAWVTLNKPHFQECLGRHVETGEYMYTLGRMCFDMFPRGDLKCCIKGMFNIVGDAREEIENEGLLLPRTVKNEDLSELLTYNISTAFAFDGTNQRAILTNHGYMLCDPNIPHRFSVWFSRGMLEPDFSENNNGQDDGLLTDWKELFGAVNAQRSLVQHAKVLAARLLLGIQLPDHMEEDGSMEYIFKRPIPGYCDVLYQDENLRIFKGHHGSVYVMYRIS